MPTNRHTAFRQLHQSGTFIIPNPYDPGTARYLQSLGFKALATTSAGFAFSRALPDADWAVPRDLALAHITDIVNSTDLPINADFESGYAHDPAAVAANVTLCAATGVSGLSIEDRSDDPAHPLYDLPLATARIRAARQALDASHPHVLLTARAECFFTDLPDPLNESIRRLQAYSAAGADVLYAPGPRSREHIQALVQAVAPKPLNVLMAANTGLTLADLASLGVRRISVGSALARVAWTAFIHAAESIAKDGTFTAFENLTTNADLNHFFQKDFAARNKSPRSLS